MVEAPHPHTDIQFLGLLTLDPGIASIVASCFHIQIRKRNNPAGPVRLFVAAPGSLSILAQGWFLGRRKGGRPGKEKVTC